MMKKLKTLVALVEQAKESGCEVLKESDIYLLTGAYQEEYDRLCDLEDLVGEESENYIPIERHDLGGAFWMQAGCDGIFYLGMTMEEVYETLSGDGVIDQYAHLFGNKTLGKKELDYLATIEAD
jgi:hypothetical protein